MVSRFGKLETVKMFNLSVSNTKKGLKPRSYKLCKCEALVYRISCKCSTLMYQTLRREMNVYFSLKGNLTISLKGIFILKKSLLR